MAPERWPEHTNQRAGVNTKAETLPTDPLPEPKRKNKGKAPVGAIITTLLTLQTSIIIDRTIRTNERPAATVASAGILYLSRTPQIAREPIPPSLSKINTPAHPEDPLVPITKPSESQVCNEGWEQLNEGVCFTKLREHESDVYAVRVYLKNPKVSVRPSFVTGPGKLGSLKDGAERQGAIAAINASFIIGSRTLGPIVYNGDWLHKDAFPQQVLIVQNDNSAKILPTNQALMEDPTKMRFALSGSHSLVQNGITYSDFEQDNPTCMLYCVNRRTAIGIDAEGQLIMVVVDGQSPTSRGMKIPELAGVMGRMGATNAIALDGGKQSGMITKDGGQVSKGKILPITTFVGVYPKI